MKKSFLALCTLILMFMFVGCSSKTEETGAKSDTSQEPQSENEENIELRMAWWGGQERHDRTLKVIELYEERNPNVKIVAEYSGFDGYFDKLSTQIAAGNAPDIVQYGGNLNDFVNRGVVLPLDEYVGNSLDLSKHDQSMIDAATFDGKFYGVTLGTNARGVLLNKTLFEEANVPLPSEEWTWEDFKEIANQLSANLDGIYGTSDFQEDGFGTFLAQQDKYTYLDGEVGFEAQDTADWFQMWKELRESGGAALAEIQVSASQTPEQSLIVQRTVAMEAIASNQLGAYTNASEDEFVLYINPYHSETGKNGVGLRPSQFLAGTADTKHPEEVAKFLDFFVNDLEATAILGNDRGAPVNSEVRASLLDSGDEIDQAIFAYIDWVSSTSDAPYIPNLPGYNENTQLFKETSERIYFDQATVDEAAEAYYKELLENIEKFSE
ncbi:ABC transporter substrate-binding protein [Halalkalibacter urbisdiaboli]|uniref:ABC transporter substrate-binding protein n=1 Tax=Halalkalibacter urbisdiaboli TaxID=1960589 RepID=UPI000B42E481|nr:extracellular solute-binding protein [Halalkalibacter urbisdiaboli]